MQNIQVQNIESNQCQLNNHLLFKDIQINISNLLVEADNQSLFQAPVI